MIADLEESEPESILKPIRRKITLHDVKEMAKLVAKGHTETEASLLCGFPVRQWFRWKERNKAAGKFDILLSGMKAQRIANNLAQIDKAATGTGGVRHDWRAADRLNAIIAPERFAQNREQTVHNHQTAIIAAVGSEEQLAKLVAMYAGQAQTQQNVIEVEPVKQIGPSEQRD